MSTAAQTAARRAPIRAGAVLLPLILFSLGHFFVDLYSGALGALQPLLVAKHGLTMAQAGLLGGVLVVSTSLMQPLYGILSDRIRTRLFSALGPAVAGIFISALGLAPAYGWLLAMVALGGAGVAAFHPQASSGVTLGIEEKRGRAMAIFVSAGTLGMASGPLYFSAATRLLGLPQTWLAALPGIAMSALLLTLLPTPAEPASTAPFRSRLRSASEPRPRWSGGNGSPAAFSWSPLRACWKPIALLYTLVFLRSTVQVVFAQFVPLYLVTTRGYSLGPAAAALSAYMTAGAAGGFLGGHLADRFGGRFVITISMIGSVPLLLAFLLTTGPLSILALALGGFVLLFTIPVNVVMAQDLVPSQAGTVSALMMGFGWGSAGMIFVPLTGWLSDHFSLQTALLTLMIYPLIGFVLSSRLPKK